MSAWEFSLHLGCAPLCGIASRLSLKKRRRPELAIVAIQAERLNAGRASNS